MFLESGNIILKEILPEDEANQIKVSNPVRLGATNAGTKPRMLRIEVESEEVKWKIIKNAYKLNEGLDWSDPNKRYINLDYTRKERERNQKLREELKRRRMAGEKNIRIKGDQIVTFVPNQAWIENIVHSVYTPVNLLPNDISLIDNECPNRVNGNIIHNTNKDQNETSPNDIFYNIIYSNLDTITNKKHEIKDLVQQENPDIICFTEIFNKKDPNIEVAELKIDGYDIFLEKNPQRGVIIYTKECLKAQEFTEFQKLNFKESSWCSFETPNNEKVLIGNIYHSPNSNIENTNKQAQRRAAAETVARKPIEHFIHSMNN